MAKDNVNQNLLSEITQIESAVIINGDFIGDLTIQEDLQDYQKLEQPTKYCLFGDFFVHVFFFL